MARFFASDSLAHLAGRVWGGPDLLVWRSLMLDNFLFRVSSPAKRELVQWYLLRAFLVLADRDALAYADLRECAAFHVFLAHRVFLVASFITSFSAGRLLEPGAAFAGEFCAWLGPAARAATWQSLLAEIAEDLAQPLRRPDAPFALGAQNAAPSRRRASHTTPR